MRLSVNSQQKYQIGSKKKREGTSRDIRPVNEAFLNVKKLTVNYIYLKSRQLSHELCSRVAWIFTVEGWEQW